MLSIQYKPTADLIPYINNSRTHSEQQVQQVAASIKEFGFTNPILIDWQGGIIAGHGRLQAAQMLGMESVPTITLKDLSDAQKKAYVIADNQLALNAGWDLDKLKVELESLEGLNFNIDLLGFDDDFLKDLIDDDEQEDEGEYTKKVEIPTYEPSGEKPDIEELFNDEKTFELLDEISSCSLPQKEKDFLRLAAGRHTVIDFEKVADYYAHSSKECQELMESSALVLIDFDKAIEKGFASLSDKISATYLEDYPDEA